MKPKIVIALAGNPNSGKTTIFNKLTGARQHVGNYPGVTVERKEGYCRYGDMEMQIVDLPGTYSLTAYSTEELVARNFLIDEKPDVVVDIIDASNLERNLYLAVQLMELGVPLVLAFNMSDQARAQGHEFDIEKLSSYFGASIVQTVGHKGTGMKELLEAIVATAKDDTSEMNRNDENLSGVLLSKATIHSPFRQRPVMDYGREIEEEIARLESLIKLKVTGKDKDNLRWLALKLLENDKAVRARFDTPEINSQLEKNAARIEKILGEHPETAIAGRRYGFISGACREAVRSTIELRHTISERIDAVATNRLLGIPIFMGLMYLVFQLTFTLGDPPMKWIEEGFGWLGAQIVGWWPKGSESALKSLLVDGIIGGVGGVIVFLPNILLLFLAIAILEDSGYMARAAFIMDRVMHKIGLHGKSFIPMLIGFGCSVPAIMATRTLENRRDRLVTMLVTPLMSCGARLPIYALIIPAFFPQVWHAPMLWLIYVIGIVLAVLSAKLLRSTILKGESVPFVMELPPYRMPTLKSVLIHMWERGWLYLKKAGTIILCISILLWAMTSYPKKTAFDVDYEAEAAKAETSYLSKVQQMNLLLGLPGGSPLLVQALQAELDMAAEQEKYHEQEAGYADATKKKEDNILGFTQAPGGDQLSHFLKMRDDIQKAKADFAEAVSRDELEEGSSAHSSLAGDRDTALEALRRAKPDVYAAVVYYMDTIDTPFKEEKAQIEQAKQAEEMAYSVAGRIGHALEPFLKPMGFDWKIGTALIGAFAAKEVFVAQMGIVYSVGEADEKSEALREHLRSQYSPLTAFCIMLFCLISAPCMATIAVTKRESNSWKWALFQLGGLTALACVLTVMVFQAGSLLGIGV
ncbi:MAG: ferrous iron transport protein B [Syntrophales bacterium]|jgi:ferrous iron transport protein B|nr:ferrous iron transport protein B [Syntrophales bacterium]MCK9528008.1 ferrous iron transport protein B [Syntrophales bacterium]MDX9921415.1 ferrous iron transport protein B [Syntrophales bacterium]